MARYILLASTECTPGTDEVFNAWYDAVHVKEGAIGAMNGVRYTYEADGEKFTKVYHVAGIACITPKSCKGPKGLDDPGFEKRVLREAGLLPKES